MWWGRGSRREQLAPIQPQAGIGRVLVRACFVRRKFSPHLAYSDRKRASGCSHATSKHRATSAGLLATADEPASGTFLMPSIRDGRVPLAAAGLRLERRLRWQVRASPWLSLRSDRDYSPEWLPLAACSNAPDVSCISADHRAPGRPWATAVALSSHTSRGSSSLRHRCAVCAAGLGNGHALRLVRPAARQLTAVAQHLQGPLASARSCVPLRVRSITTGVSHLYRADPSSGHQAPMLLRDAGGCDDGSATRCTCSRALSSLADSDPKARSALRIRKEGKSIASTGKPGRNQRTCAFCPSV